MLWLFGTCKERTTNEKTAIEVDSTVKDLPVLLWFFVPNQVPLRFPLIVDLRNLVLEASSCDPLV